MTGSQNAIEYNKNLDAIPDTINAQSERGAGRVLNAKWLVPGSKRIDQVFESKPRESLRDAFDLGRRVRVGGPFRP